jgi:superfamily II DNA or RNA helicase
MIDFQFSEDSRIEETATPAHAEGGMALKYGSLIDLESIPSLGKDSVLKASRLHEQAMLELAEAEAARGTARKNSAMALFSSAFQKEKQVAGMLEPGMQVEPIRSFLHLNAARLAIECRDMESARHMAADAMRGMPPTDLLDDFRQVFEASSRPEAPAPQGEQIADARAHYGKKPTILTTNLSRRNRFLDQFLALLPEAEMVDIIASNFEIASFLLLAGQWQFARQVRMVIGRSRVHPGQAGPALTNTEKHDLAIEREKARTDDVSGLYAVKAAIAEGRLQIGVHTKDEIHGAAYIIRTRDGGIHGYIGSAEFTESGLIHPLQLMAAVTDGHCTELARLFDSLHASSHNINEPLAALIDRHLREYTPYQVYLKALYEYFRGREITAGTWESKESKVYRILSDYQRDGYRQLLHIAGKYGGALLCDGVGLGKTFIALMLIERLVYERKRVAVIVPKSTREAIWEVLIKQYVPNARGLFGNQVVVYNHTDLLRVSTRDRDFPAEMDQIRDQCDAIIVDEAHHFRNLSSQRNQKLFELTANKLIFLLTATPINNSLFDLQHLMEFFTRRDDNRFGYLGINSIRGHLIQKEKAIEAVMGMAEGEEAVISDFDVTAAQRILKDDTLFRETVVQRSRTYVKQREQSSETILSFPDRQPPQVAAYSLQQTYGPLLDDLRRAFDRDDPLLKLPIYYPMAYGRRPAESVEDRKEENRQRQVVGLVRTTMLKRFESSWKAFQYTCEDLLLKVMAAHRQLDDRRYEKWRDANALWLHEIERHMAQRYDQAVDAEDVEEEDLLSAFMDRDFSFDKRLFKVKEMVADIEQDMALLVTFLGRLRGLSSEQDTKVQTLLDLLKQDVLLSKHKVVVFTEFRDTARYLFETLKAAGIRHLFEIDSTSKVDRLDVIRRFAPFYNYHDEAILQKALASPIRVLISTDILAEGLNLQDAFLMINYDLHWNPVRLMQRIGRVDRRMNPDTEARILQNKQDEKGLRGKMWFWNFLPPAELNDLLSLYHRVSHKVLRISETTGLEVEKLLTPDDHFKTLKDFNAAYEGQATTEEQLRLLLNKALQDDPNLESFLQDLPWRVFSAKPATAGMPGIFACYRFPPGGQGKSQELGELRWYFLPDGSDKVLTTLDEINHHIASEPATPRLFPRPLKFRRDRLKAIEAHIRTRDLKARKSITMAQVAGGQEASDGLKLVAWMDVAPPEER